MANLNLYSLSLLPPTSITSAITGQFSGTKQHEIVVARGSILEVFKVDSNNAKVSITYMYIYIYEYSHV